MASSLLLTLITLVSLLISSEGQLRVEFYSSTCPTAELIVSSVVRQFTASDRNNPAALLRLHFHDCFVEGCDASILIDGPPTIERRAMGHQGLRGFDVITAAKARLESTCPGVVSCADIVALAARDSVLLSGGPFYQVPTGRRDGRVSNISLAVNMPEVTDSIQKLKQLFADKGLTNKDLVVLSAAHTIGTTACFFMTHRLYDFSGNSSDPSINPRFLPELKNTCPKGGDVNVRLAMDHGSEFIFDTQILRNIREGFAVLESDAQLNADPVTKRIVDSYFSFFRIFGPSFTSDFADSMVRMGMIDVKTGTRGEIRRVCNTFN